MEEILAVRVNTAATLTSTPEMSDINNIFGLRLLFQFTVLATAIKQVYIFPLNI